MTYDDWKPSQQLRHQPCINQAICLGAVMQRKVVCKNVVFQQWSFPTFDLCHDVSHYSYMDTAKNVLFIRLERSFDVDSFAYQTF